MSADDQGPRGVILRRLAAVVVAVAMVAGALAWRAHRDNRDETASGTRAPGHAVLVCSTELAQACAELPADAWGVEIVIEPAATTEATLTGAENAADTGFDAWLVPDPFPAMVAAQRTTRSQATVLAEQSAPVASSPLVLIAWKDRRAVLDAACDAPELFWRCIGDMSGTPWADHGGQSQWGPVKPGLSQPTTTATGLFTIAQASASWFGRTDYASNDFADPEFQRWLRQLARGAPNPPVPPRTPLDDMLSKGSATFDITAAPLASAQARITASRDRDRLEIVYPAQPVMFDVVVAPVAGSEAGARLVGLLSSKEAAAAFERAGWDAGPDVTSPTGLPGPGVLQALRSLWKQVS